jgi:RNA polymerase sigma-70 factor, ECF subfamily
MWTSPLAPIQKLLGINDEQLMWRTAMQDDETAFTCLMGRWQSPVYLCLRMTGDSHRAEELTQETFTRIFIQRRGYQQRSRFSTWLWRIALNLCYDELRARRRREQSWLGPTDETDNPALTSPGPSPDRHAADAEEGQIVRQALDALPEAYRTVLILRHYQDLKFREIADVLGIPEGTVKSRMAEALSQLSHQLPSTLKRSAPEEHPSLTTRSRSKANS